MAPIIFEELRRKIWPLLENACTQIWAVLPVFESKVHSDLLIFSHLSKCKSACARQKYGHAHMLASASRHLSFATPKSFLSSFCQ